MNGETRKQALIAATLVLVVAVLADQFGVFDRAGGSGAGNGGSGGGASAASLQAKAELLADQEALIAKRADWERAKRSADEVLAEIGDRMIRGRTVQLAENELKEHATREISAIGLKVERSDSATPGAAKETGVRRVGLTLSLTTDNPAKVNELVDRLENMSDLVTSVERVKITGPGAMPSRGSVEVTITLMGLAMINGSGGEA